MIVEKRVNDGVEGNFVQINIPSTMNKMVSVTTTEIIDLSKMSKAMNTKVSNALKNGICRSKSGIAYRIYTSLGNIFDIPVSYMSGRQLDVSEIPTHEAEKLHAMNTLLREANGANRPAHYRQYDSFHLYDHDGRRSVKRIHCWDTHIGFIKIAEALEPEYTKRYGDKIARALELLASGAKLEYVMEVNDG